MRVDFDDTYCTEFDGLSFQLIKKRVITAAPEGARGIKAKPENIGKTVEQVLGYYGTLPQVVQGYLKQDIGTSEKETFLDVLDAMEAFIARIDAIFARMDPEMRRLYREAKEAEEAANKAAKEKAADGVRP